MQKTRPNFIFINTDQHRADCFSFSRRRRGLVTPHLDNLAMCGMRFHNAYATCPVCIPQRMSLMSGQLPSTHGVLCNAGIPFWGIEHTLPGELRDNGYQTALIGRDMHLDPMEMGFGFEHQEISTADCNCDYFKFLASHSPPEANGLWGQRGAIQSFIPHPWHLPDWQHLTNWTVDRSINWLHGRDPSCPFFLTVGFNQPHTPNSPPRHYLDRYLRMADLGQPVIGDWAIPPANDGIGVSPDSSYLNLTGVNLHTCLAGYYAEINLLDDAIGRLLAYLQAARLAQKTYVIFSADHGEMLGDHYHFQKSVPYEGASHIPMFIRGPGIAGGGECESPVGWHDLMPTLLDLAGIDVPDTAADGISLGPVLRGESLGIARNYIHGECLLADVSVGEPFPGQQVQGNVAYEQGVQFVTDGREKYIWFPRGGIEQFFNLRSDPDECHDLAVDPAYAERVEFWRQRLVKMLEDRPEGYVVNGCLVAGKEMPPRLPHAQAQYDAWDSSANKAILRHTNPLRSFFPLLG